MKQKYGMNCRKITKQNKQWFDFTLEREKNDD